MAYYRTPHDVTALPAWQALNQHRENMHNFSMREAFNADPQRFNQFTLSSCGLFLDYSKNLITSETRNLLVGLANEVDLQGAIKALFAGEPVNSSEGRPALHTALRRPVGDKLLVNGANVMPDVHKVLNQITELVGRIHDGLWRGYTEKPITDVVNIGIGGSFLGSYTHKGVRCHYLANIDGSEFHELSAKIRAETTLFIVSSKSFNTLETLKNAQAARAWYLAQGGSEAELYKHFIAVSSNNAAAVAFGIREENIFPNIFPMWDWVGGRYSLWSAIGLPIALAIGMSNFKELLSGAYTMDQHFQNAPFEQNMPVLLALLGVWYGNFWGAQSHAILPYDHYLRNITKHLQQLDMESNGKSVRQDGTPVSTELREKGMSEADVQKLAPHKVIPGNRPSNTLVVERISPRRLGALVAMYEHKVFVQSVIWGINAFDQWGVELGKELGKGVYNRLTGSEESAAEDASTQGLINYFRGRHRG